MGTKNTPGDFDCYANALPDEPMFVLLARDPHFRELVEEWGRRRALDIAAKLRPDSDSKMVAEAFECAVAGERWRAENDGKWRAKK